MDLEVGYAKDKTGTGIAEIPAIPGCDSEGETREEALENVKDTARLCQEVRKEVGLPRDAGITVDEFVATLK